MGAPLPALLMVPELLPGGGPLNGRRWAGQQLLKLWLALAGDRELPLLAADARIGAEVHSLLRSWGASNAVRVQELSQADLPTACGALLVPDPSIGLWSYWRDAMATPASFSLIGQIHTLCTVGAMTRLEELTSENVFGWDALVCSSAAGRTVVESVLEQREERQAMRAGVAPERLRQHRPQLPVIPLPMPVREMQAQLPPRLQARQALGLPDEADVLLWIGRLTLFTKADPAPLYRLLERLAKRRNRPLILLELGPDDGENQARDLQKLRAACSSVRFLRLGAEQPVSEERKHQALAAADLGVSLVDNLQETFGQSVVELLAAGLPVVASNWDGYRDLISHGQNGFLVPSRWASVAEKVSVRLGWQYRVGALPYSMAAGALAQLVQLDLQAAESAIDTLLREPCLRLAMGRQAARSALARFDGDVVARHYAELSAELEQRRQSVPACWQMQQTAPLCVDPVRCFAGFPSDPPSRLKTKAQSSFAPLPPGLVEGRDSLWQVLREVLPEHQQADLLQALHIKHGQQPYHP